jgi:uncharacterized protein YbcI
MPAPDDVLTGEELLVAVADAMVEFHQSYHDRVAVTGKALLLGDELLACVVGDAGGDVEQTMFDLQGTTILQKTRSPFQEEMQDRFIAMVTRLSGRHVQAFISNSNVDPDMEIELFMLKPTRDVRTEPQPPATGGRRGYAYAGERPHPE